MLRIYKRKQTVWTKPVVVSKPFTYLLLISVIAKRVNLHFVLPTVL
jgi:hypothetical protein